MPKRLRPTSTPSGYWIARSQIPTVNPVYLRVIEDGRGARLVVSARRAFVPFCTWAVLSTAFGVMVHRSPQGHWLFLVALAVFLLAGLVWLASVVYQHARLRNGEPLIKLDRASRLLNIAGRTVPAALVHSVEHVHVEYDEHKGDGGAVLSQLVVVLRSAGTQLEPVVACPRVWAASSVSRHLAKALGVQHRECLIRAVTGRLPPQWPEECEHCGYSMSGLASPVCPECGAARPGTSIVAGPDARSETP